MLKINYILNHWHPASTTHFAHTLNLLRRMKERGCAINLLIEKAPMGGPEIDGIRVEVLRLNAPFLRHVEMMIRLGRAILQGYRSTFIRISAPAAIVASISHMLFGGRAFLWQSGATHEFDRSRPLTVGKLRWMLHSAFPNFLARALCQRFVTGPDTMVTYYSEVVGIAPEKIRMLFNDIELEAWSDVSFAHPMKTYERPGVARTSRVLLLVHRLSPVRKTAWYLGPLLSDLRSSFGFDWTLLIVGEGPEQAEIMRLVDTLGVKECCIFLGAVPNRELPAVYRSADLFVNPSYAEGFPRVILEAMASGLPIVTTDAGGTMDLLGPAQSRWVVSRDEPILFSKKVVELLSEPMSMLLLAKENELFVERFSTSKVAEMYMKVLGED